LFDIPSSRSITSRHRVTHKARFRGTHAALRKVEPEGPRREGARDTRSPSQLSNLGSLIFDVTWRMLDPTLILSPVAQGVLIYFEDLLTLLGLGVIGPEDLNTSIDAKYGTLSPEDLEAFSQAWTIRHPTQPKGEIVGEALQELTRGQAMSEDAAAATLREAAIRHSREMVKFFEDGLVERLQAREPKN
jgi:hypothetical protein